jgi:hypothetical protein
MTLDDLDLSEEAFDENGGWGLQIVQALSARCGAVRDPVGGKWIWARVLVGGAAACPGHGEEGP